MNQLPRRVQAMLNAITAPRPRRAKPQRAPPAGLHPVDGRGQYISPKPTSKRNRGA